MKPWGQIILENMQRRAREAKPRKQTRITPTNRSPLKEVTCEKCTRRFYTSISVKLRLCCPTCGAVVIDGKKSH